MSFRLSRKLSCFYCGSGSAQKFTGAPCVFQCRHCEATNHVNEHGQPTEPPPPPTPDAGSSLRFGRPASPPRFSTDPPLPPPMVIFCNDCQRNQLITEKVATCAQQSYKYKQIPRSCLPDLQALMPLALIIGLLSIWWNPLLRRSQLKRGGYFVGLPTFYFLQLIALSWLSHKAVRLEWKSPVSFRLQNKDLLPDIPEIQQDATPTPAHDSQPWNYLKRGPPPRFPIEALAPQSSRPISRDDQGNTSLFYNTNQPPTPPPEADVMDWSPEGRSHHTNFHLQSHPGAVLQQHIPTYPSPFHGTLPAAPVAPAARLHNPNQFSPSVFRKATEHQKDSLFKNMHISQPTQDTQSQPQSRREYSINPNIYNGYTSDDSTLDAEQHPHQRNINVNTNTNINIPYNQLRTDSRFGGATTTGSRPNMNANTGRPRHDFPMQQPRFFPQQDTAETGLEDLFGGRSFGIDDVVATPESGSSANAGWGEWFAKGVLKARGSG